MNNYTSRRFVLYRKADATGVSGTGTVAEGIEFTDGTVALRWLTETSSTAVYTSVADVIAIHGHHGNTELHYLDGPDAGPVHVPASRAWVLARVPHVEHWISQENSVWGVHYEVGPHLDGSSLTPAEVRRYAALYLAAADEAERRNSA